MKKKERVINSLNHKESDIVPYDVGFTWEAYKIVSDYLKEDDLYGKIGGHLNGMVYSGYPQKISDDKDIFIDDFKVIWNRSGVDKDIGVVEKPFVIDLDDFTFPEIKLDETRIRNQCEYHFNSKGDYFNYAGIGFSMFERAWSLCGMENILMGMLVSPSELEELLENICDFNMKLLDIILEYDFDGIYFGDDWGQQKGLIMGAEHWRRFIKPQMKKMYQKAKSKGKYILQHSCGDIFEVFPDLIEIGLDCYQTFQPEIYDIEKVKKEYGKDLTFWGGISTQQLLPHSPVDKVREETIRIMNIMRKNGGYIAAPTHSLTFDIPPENVLAIIDIFQNQDKYLN